ncbi:MAG: YdcF family protein [Oscillospiraceae bacterium]|nr:YdcF family protein [Oscillospiraceae bacterium]
MKTEKQGSRGRRITGDILLALVILLTADVAVVMLHKINTVVLKADYREVFRYELILCAILLLFALDVRFRLFTRSKRLVLRIAGWILRSVVILLTLVILFFCGKVICGSLINTAGRADYAIVLGLALENGQPTDDLLARLDTAQAYLEEYPEARLILTGGNADESGRTEAAVMHDLLAERGVPEERMILEDQAESTKDNFRNTAQIIDPGKPVVLISSNYHMDRAVQTAESAGFTKVLRLPAPSSFFCYGANMMSEVILELNELTLRR